MAISAFVIVWGDGKRSPGWVCDKNSPCFPPDSAEILFHVSAIVGSISQAVVAKFLAVLAEEDPLKVPVRKGFIQGQLAFLLSKLRLLRNEIRIPVEGRITGNRDLVIKEIRQEDGVLWFFPETEGGSFPGLANQAVRMAIKHINAKIQGKVKKRSAVRLREGQRRRAPAKPNPVEDAFMKFAKEAILIDGKRVGIRLQVLLEGWQDLVISEVTVDGSVRFTLATSREPDLSFQPSGPMSANLQISTSFLQSILTDNTLVEDSPLGAVVLEGKKARIDGNQLLVPVKIGGEEMGIRVEIANGQLRIDVQDVA